MLSEEELNSIIKQFQSKPFLKIDKSNCGSGLVLRYLDEASRPVSAGEISKYMGVSTARVAVLLRSLSKKGLIERGFDVNDARKTIVKLSAKGKEFVSEKKAEGTKALLNIVEKIGVERIKTFIEISNEIADVISGMCIELCKNP